jgi:hypothetical protein
MLRTIRPANRISAIRISAASLLLAVAQATWMPWALERLGMPWPVAGPTTAWADDLPALRVSPSKLQFEAPESSEQLLIFEQTSDGSTLDATRRARYSTTTPGVVRVTARGRVLPQGDGQTEVLVQVGEQVCRVSVRVQGVAEPPPISFERDIVPILSKAGCNSGACHGKAEGQNGFKLSVFGYDAEADQRAIAQEARGRRVFPAAPHRSLLLLKATAEVPHGGGQKVEFASLAYKRLLRWITEGMTLKPPREDPIVAIEVEPAEVTLPPRGTQQLRVTAVHKGGRRRCVTAEAEFQSNNEAIAGVDPEGLTLATEVPGEAAILVRYLGHVGVCRVTRPRDSVEFVRPAENNFIDRLVWDKLQRLRVMPSPPADDPTFLRRVFLDTIGTLPTPDEARRFLADSAPDKRLRLIRELLDRPEYVDYWTQRWSDLLRVDKDTITPQGAVAMSRWVRGQLQLNTPYDEFVRQILTAQGSTLDESPAAFFQAQADAEQSARAVSQLFLGVRIECAQCHHHPFERWDQQDYFALAGFFTGLDRKPGPLGGSKIVVKQGASLKHPRTGELVPPAGLGAEPADLTILTDRRQALAQWATRRDNPYFTRAIVNRLWAHYLGRGLVEPIDDLRATNPASNEPLLDALAEHLIELRYDLKAFTQTLLRSQVYQLSAQPNDSNRLDEQNYSRAAWKPLPAEVLLDAISQATGVPESFNGWPKGYRAIQLWDNKLPSHFLEVFGRPARLTVCACERGSEPSIAQALHLMNAPATSRKVQDRAGRAAQLVNPVGTDPGGAPSGGAPSGGTGERTPDQILDELYLATLSRFPSDDERQWMRRAFASAGDRREAVEDILWTLLNTREFVFNH